MIHPVRHPCDCIESRYRPSKFWTAPRAPNIAMLNLPQRALAQKYAPLKINDHGLPSVDPAQWWRMTATSSFLRGPPTTFCNLGGLCALCRWQPISRQQSCFLSHHSSLDREPCHAPCVSQVPASCSVAGGLNTHQSTLSVVGTANRSSHASRYGPEHRFKQTLKGTI